MTKGAIDITVSGGNANFGNILQGDANQLSAGSLSISAQIDEAFAQLIASLDGRCVQQPHEQAQIEALKAELAALQEAAKTGKPTGWGSIAETAKVLYERYGWAGGLLKKLFGLLVPGWLP
jgi:hypothetical protein